MRILQLLISFIITITLGVTTVAVAQSLPHSSASIHALVFRSSMYAKVFEQNFKLQAHSFALSEPLRSSAKLNLNLLRHETSSLVASLCLSQNRSSVACASAANDLLRSSVRALEQEGAANQFAEWLFALDGDNWFSFDAAKREAHAYLVRDGVSLIHFESFDPDGRLVDLLSTEGLPVVIDRADGTLTIWTYELAD